ncbi:hypothetical protein F4821DRAFT_253878 [Hypoxylon rubiginosum]|uniref:Uncharacterized protein n=1 Tax=Hypoxylon rubiginosum TaxID=110542 RepID=A0ACC0DIC5_9PEZI|nr:hypothetical protein F4821DRAFT_253878 [Hypoxylon rubiginosum]
MPKTKNCRSRKREFFEGLLSSDDEPMVLKNRKRRLTNAKNPTTPKKSDKSNSRTPKSNHSTPTSSPAGPSSGNQGLDWEWVKTLDQDPTEKDYFPERFDPPEELGVLGQDLDKPDLDFTGDLEAFSIWVLARLRDKRATNAIAAMLSDPNVKVKWQLAVNTYFKNSVCRYRDIAITLPGPNHEAAYAAMCGIVLPPEHACMHCKANKTVFTYCIVLPGYLNGACVGCHYNNSGSRCSHRPHAKTRIHATATLLDSPTTPPATSLIPMSSTRGVSNPNAVRNYVRRQPRSTSGGSLPSDIQRQDALGDAPRASLEGIREKVCNALEQIEMLITESNRRKL